MKAAVLTHHGFELREFDIPVFSDDDVLIKTTSCGVCSGDVFIYSNRDHLVTEPRRLGHEGSGTIVQVGRNVINYKVGDVVTALGTPAYSEYYVTRSENVVRLHSEIDPTFALGEAIACCVHAGNRFGIKPDDKIAVIGCGFMGLICLQLAIIQGAGFSCCIDPLINRREKSIELGADVTLDPFEDGANDILERFGEFDVVIEAAGTQSAIDLCTDLVTKHGRIILVGYHQSNDGKRSVNMERWNYKAIDVVNGHVRRTNEKLAAMAEGMRLLGQGHLRTEPLVTTYDLAEVEQAFIDLTAGKEGLFKAVLTMNGS